MTLGSGDSARLPRPGRPEGRFGGWVRRGIARWRHLNRLQGLSRTEFEQVARDLDLSHPELYWLLTGCNVSVDLLERNLAAIESSPDRIRAGQTLEAKQISTTAQALLAIGPSCC